MKKSCFTLLALTFLFVSTTASLVSQGFSQEACIIILEGQNKNRTVAGAVNEECGGGWHSAPWGNWGVSSNYGGKTDKDQFRGWKHEDGPWSKKQWNSCTTDKAKYRARNCKYYNTSNCTKQGSSATVTHGRRSYRTASRYCLPSWMEPISSPGCSQVGGFSQSSNHMTLYELDLDGSDLVETLYFPGTSVTFTNCNRQGCSQKTTSWVDMSRGTSPTAHVEAQLRMKASAYLEGDCAVDWNW